MHNPAIHSLQRRQNREYQESKRLFFRAHVHGRRGGLCLGRDHLQRRQRRAHGAGLLPAVLGILLALLGMAITFKALMVETMDGDKIGKWAWKPLIFIIVANLVFGVLARRAAHRWAFRRMGLIVAIYALTFIASMRRRRLQAQGSHLHPGHHSGRRQLPRLRAGCSSCSSRCGPPSSPAEEHQNMDLFEQSFAGFRRRLHADQPAVLPSSAACWAR